MKVQRRNLLKKHNIQSKQTNKLTKNKPKFGVPWSLAFQGKRASERGIIWLRVHLPKWVQPGMGGLGCICDRWKGRAKCHPQPPHCPSPNKLPEKSGSLWWDSRWNVHQNICFSERSNDQAEAKYCLPSSKNNPISSGLKSFFQVQKGKHHCASRFKIGVGSEEQLGRCQVGSFSAGISYASCFWTWVPVYHSEMVCVCVRMFVFWKFHCLVFCLFWARVFIMSIECIYHH